MNIVPQPDGVNSHSQPTAAAMQISSGALDAGSGLVRWQPRSGPEMQALLEHLALPPAGAQALVHSSIDILARCITPEGSDGCETGLVIGNIQSGKTMSFTAVTALARDNDYQLIVIITGISQPLLEQSTLRLTQDLRLDEERDRAWLPMINPNPRGEDRRMMRDALAEWRDPDVPRPECQTILITVMKNHVHLRNLARVLGTLNLTGVPALIIDDEADQAGLNTLVRQQDESRTYQRLIDLRHCVPNHTFLQYTATPQAPLLINLIDALSPSFAELLTPGPDYTGGREFFIEHPALIRTIPDDEIPERDHPLREPPDTLMDAMRLFFVGAAVGLIQDGARGNRSMLVHPSLITAGHKQYLHWVTQIKEKWQDILDLPETDADRIDVIEDFRAAYDDLNRTVNALPPFDDISKRLKSAIRRTIVTEVNATRGRTPSINWRSAYAHILVGGQAMDRGFTVEGLTVTYMPRSLGAGQADTVQQRARFFGYKRPYLGFCRIYLPGAVVTAYTHYIEHEEDVHRQLVKHRASGKHLDEWKRAFFLNRDLQPTRHNVLDLDYMRSAPGEEWLAPRAPHDSHQIVEANRHIVAAFVDRLHWHDDDGHRLRTPIQRHKVATDVPLSDVVANLLLPLRISRPTDSQRNTGMLLQLQAYLEYHPQAKCTVYLMSGGQERERGLDEHDEIRQLFQGSNSHGGELIYPGDREIKAPTGVTVQIHYLELRGEDESHHDVPVVAVRIPREIAKDWLVQNQGGSDGTTRAT